MNYSPLRYPGGKTKLAPLIALLMQNCQNKCHTYIEPFAGGAGVALFMLLENKVDTIIINDYDKAIYSFWRAVKEDTDKLLDLIEKTPLTIEEWKKQKYIFSNSNQRYSVDLAFAAFYLNRTNHSGVLTGGPIGGFEQQGRYLIDARYNRHELMNRIGRIAERKSAILVYNKEVRAFITQVVSSFLDNAFVYFDPPYYKKGKDLYKNFFKPDDHQRIAESIVQNVQCDWIVTYDDVPQIETLYEKYPRGKMRLRYSVASSSPSGSEIIVFKHSRYIPDALQLAEQKIEVHTLCVPNNEGAPS